MKKIIFCFVVILVIGIKSVVAFAEDIPVDATKIDITDGSTQYYTVTETGNYIIDDTDGRRGVEINVSNSTRENPVRIYIKNDIIMNGDGAVFWIISGGYIEIIGVGQSPIKVNTVSGKNFLAYKQNYDLDLKVRNIVVDSDSTKISQNQVVIWGTSGKQNVEFSNVTFQNWYSNSNFTVALISEAGGGITAQFNNCNFINNSGEAGGGLSAKGSNSSRVNLTLNNCCFDNNTNNKTGKNITQAAGAINVRSYASAVINGGIIKNGKITGVSSTGEKIAGGIAVASDAELHLNNVEICDNQGDGVYNAGKIFMMGKTKIHNNARYGVSNTSDGIVIFKDNIIVEDNGEGNINNTAIGTILDEAFPTISGISDGKTYCNTVAFEIEDMYLEKVLIDNIEQNIEKNKKYVIQADNKEHEVVAIDKTGNTTRVRCTVNNSHTWNKPVFTWNENYSRVVAKFVCTYDETHIEELECKIEKNEIQENGNKEIYSAYVELSGNKYTDIKEIVISQNSPEKNDENNTETGSKDDKTTTNTKNEIQSNEVKDIKNVPETNDTKNIYTYIILSISAISSIHYLNKKREKNGYKGY